ncbi:YesL family protein [Bacillus xiamenensis]|uniref:YesL family protein n=1 Tax=Bacillus xiamenensis TaxID=1178537 RepID=A0ABT4F8U4_9BACI|nr:YesL family protein [Bacillus xiamenensis]EKF36557.1 integral membrane protein [Bacillus xiamenensis]MBG9910401.1 membrane protein [Bacillus xiamenensis]MCY9577058.1 YesL family protein [Bacillus xiamenensis]
MDHDGSMSRMLRMCEWVMRLAYTNLLWLLFTLLGLGIFGFMPATTALFSVMRKWIQGHDQVKVFRTFWKVYREEFVRSNVIGAVLVIIGTIIYVDLAYIYPTSWLLHVLRFAIYIFGFLFIVSLFYIFPLLAHYDWKKRFYLKFSLLLGISYLQYTLSMLVFSAVLFILFAYLPGIVPFFSISILAYGHMWLAYQVFKKIEFESEQQAVDVKKRLPSFLQSKRVNTQ